MSYAVSILIERTADGQAVRIGAAHVDGAGHQEPDDNALRILAAIEMARVAVLSGVSFERPRILTMPANGIPT